MNIYIEDIEKILPIYHIEQKSRHDILCNTLSEKEELKMYSENEISEAISYIEDLVAQSVEVAKDELYGVLTKRQAKEKICNISLSKDDNFIDIIFEIANYYARR